MILEGCVLSFVFVVILVVDMKIMVQVFFVLMLLIQKFFMVDEFDLNKMGWMQGFLLLFDCIICFDLVGNMFLCMCYGYSYVCEFVLMCVVWCGDGFVSKLLCVECDISGVLFIDLNGMCCMFVEVFKLIYIDGIFVMYKGKVIYECYFGVFDVYMQYIVMLVMKLFVGMLVVMLVVDGKFDLVVLVMQYVLELKDIVYGDVIVCQVMDMIVGVCYFENYVDLNVDVWVYVCVGGMFLCLVGYKGLDNFYDYLMMLCKEGEYDVEFLYKIVNVEMLVWIVCCVLNKLLVVLLFEWIW